jgi:hypothetical protein
MTIIGLTCEKDLMSRALQTFIHQEQHQTEIRERRSYRGHLDIDCTVSLRIATVKKADHPRSGDSCDSIHLDLYTLGYQGVDVNTYVRKLKAAGVGIVADVRETPWSHKRGFCKNALSSELSKAGIDYIHVKSAGNPKENRRTAPDLTECLRRYTHYLRENPAGINDLVQVVRIAASSNRTVCLTCFEKDVHDCHRSILVDAMRKKIRIRPVHL